MFNNGLFGGYSDEDRAKIVVNQINCLTEELITIYRQHKVKISPLIISECVEKYLMTTIFDFVFATTAIPYNLQFNLEQVSDTNQICRFCRVDNFFEY